MPTVESRRHTQSKLNFFLVTIVEDDRMDSATHQMLYMSSTLTDHARRDAENWVVLHLQNSRHQVNLSPPAEPGIAMKKS